MAHFRGNRSAFGSPGKEPRWAHSSKDGVGTAYSTGGRVWFTIWRGILTEAFYPTVDRPQMRELEFLFSDGDGLFLAERDLEYKIERMEPSQGYRIRKQDSEERFSLTKEVIVDSSGPCVLLHTRIEGDDRFHKNFKTHVFCNPHLEVRGEHNNAFVVEVSGRELLAAEKNNRWLVLGASCDFSRLSCGYVGTSDGYTDLANHHKMTFEFDEAKDGNVALTGELDLSNGREFTVGLAFGESLSSSVATLFQSLGVDYKEKRQIFMQRWETAAKDRAPLEKASGGEGRLFHSSYNLLLTHEDKLFKGAFIASPTTPFGEARGDKDGKGGYHLVWTRDMVETAMGLLAAGNTDAPLRALIYLAAQQEEDGGFPQNFWVNGEPFGKKLQLGEVAFPVLLAHRLQRLNLLGRFDPRVMVKRAAAFLLHHGPVTGEERWEESSGYSPSTLAIIISAFICAASFARDKQDEETAAFLESYADFLRSHLEEWTVATEGSLVPGAYFIRLNPAKPGEVAVPGAVNRTELKLPDQAPGSPQSYPARNVTDAGFLLLVRYGILAADDELIVNSIRAVDATLKADTPAGPCWHRYNHDGYGQQPDGSPFLHWGIGRPWPLTGERGHYELAAGRDSVPFLHAMEQFSNIPCGTGLLAEQIWDAADLPEAHLVCGGPSGSAVPLLWAHSEYLRLLRSRHDGQVFDLIPEVAARYGKAKERSKVEFWMPKYPTWQMQEGCTLRVCAPEPFRLRWSADKGATHQEGESRATAIGAEYFDLAPPALGPEVAFTFFWKVRDEWEEHGHLVQVQQMGNKKNEKLK